MPQPPPADRPAAQPLRSISIRLWAPTALLLASAASMALEIVAGRALAPYVGMSLYSWTAVIAVVLAGLTVGHWIGGALADRARRPARVAGLALLAASGATAASLHVLRLAAPASEALAPVSRIGALAAAAFLLPSLLAGLLSPLLTKIALEAEPGRPGAVLGRMYALGAAGAILGTLAAGLVMISWLGTAASALAIAATYALLAAPALGRTGGAAALVAAAALAGLARFPGALASPCAEESAYYCIRVDDAAFFGRPARIMALDHLAHGINDRDEPRLLLSPYLHLVDEIVRARWPGHALDAYFIGGGAYTLPRAWARQYPEGRMTVAEIDPEVTHLAAERMWVEPEAMEILHADARIALERLPEDRRFDVIFGDAFHDVAVPQHLVADEFHAEIARRLRPGGIYAVNVVDLLHAPRFMLSLAHTLKRRFAHVELWLDRDEIAPREARVTWVVLASDRGTDADLVDSTRGVRRQWARIETARMLALAPEGEPILLTDDYAPVDRLMRRLLIDAAYAE